MAALSSLASLAWQECAAAPNAAPLLHPNPAGWRGPCRQPRRKIDDSKQVPRLGRGFVPVEVLPFAVSFVAHRIAQLGAKLCQRTAGLDAYRTEQGNLLLDCAFGEIEDVPRLAAALSAIPGLLGHGLFLDEIDDVYVGRSDGVIHLTRGAP